MARVATRDLTRLGLVLAPGVVRGRWLVRVVLALGGLLLGAGAMRLYDSGLIQAVLSPPPAGVAAGPSPMQQQLEQSQLTLRVAESRSQELERQVATLVQQLRECQEELTFFRKTRDPKGGGSNKRSRTPTDDTEHNSAP